MGKRRTKRALGKHCSIAGGLACALERAADLECNALQFFSRNPRGWATKPLEDVDADRFREARSRLGLVSVAIHTNYLVNLAAPDPLVRERSLAAFRDELSRAARLDADYLVVHPGSARGAGVRDGISACVDGIRRAARGVDLGGVMILIENTAGQGDCIGREFEQVAEIVDRCSSDVPMGVCLDTAHTFAAGYELGSEAGFKRTMKAIAATFGAQAVRVIHFNDSKAAFGSNVDRHWHIGEGEIGLKGLGRVARHGALAHAALILETPVDADHSEAWNFGRMRGLVDGVGPSS